MDILRGILLILHFVGLASLLGGVLVQIKALKPGKARIVPAIMHGAWLQLISGIGLVGVIQMGDLGEVNNSKIGVKLVILIVLTVLAFVNRKKPTVASWIVITIGALALANIVIAVLWH